MGSYKNWETQAKNALDSIQMFLKTNVICDDNVPPDEVEKAERLYSILFDAQNFLKR